MEDRLVLLGNDGTESHRAAHVVRAVHRRSRGRLRQARSDHAVARDERREPLFIPAVGAGRALGQDEIADLGGRIPDLDFLVAR